MRVFIAIKMIHNPVIEFVTQVRKELQTLQGRIKFVEPENLHVTLQFIGEITPQILENIKTALKNISFPSFTYSIEGLGFFGNKYGDPRVIWLGIHQGKREFEELALQIKDEMKKIGISDNGKFKPHLTIGRVKSPVKPKRHFREVIQKYNTTSIYKGKASSFQLIQSHLLPEGPRYEVIEEYMLI